MIILNHISTNFGRRAFFFRTKYIPDNDHGRISKAADVYSGLQLGLGHGLGPEPAPLLLLVLVAQLGEVGQVGVAAACLQVVR